MLILLKRGSSSIVPVLVRARLLAQSVETSLRYGMKLPRRHDAEHNESRHHDKLRRKEWRLGLSRRQRLQER